VKGKVKLASPLVIPKRPYSVPSERKESLPFRVRLATSAQDLDKAVEIRASAYSRHLPHVGAALRAAEAEDHSSDVLLLIAERKIDKRAIGTMRLEPNFCRPLHVEGEIALPAIYRGKRLVETTRLGVENGTGGSMVMAALVKAAYEICHATRIDYGFALARRSMAQVFRGLCYDLVEGPVPISYANNVPLWIFAIPIGEVDSRLGAKGHAYFDFMARTEHPDIWVDYEQVREVFGTA
jgi:hypothetical protein